MDLSTMDFNLNSLQMKDISERNAVRHAIALRRIKGLAQRRISEELGVSQRLVSSYEREYTKIDYDFNQKYREAVEKLLQEVNNDAE